MIIGLSKAHRFVPRRVREHSLHFCAHRIWDNRLLYSLSCLIFIDFLPLQPNASFPGQDTSWGRQLSQRRIARPLEHSLPKLCDARHRSWHRGWIEELHQVLSGCLGHGYHLYVAQRGIFHAPWSSCSIMKAICKCNAGRLPLCKVEIITAPIYKSHHVTSSYLHANQEAKFQLFVAERQAPLFVVLGYKIHCVWMWVPWITKG